METNESQIFELPIQKEPIDFRRLQKGNQCIFAAILEACYRKSDGFIIGFNRNCVFFEKPNKCFAPAAHNFLRLSGSPLDWSIDSPAPNQPFYCCR